MTNNWEILTALRFKRGSKALVFKFSCKIMYQLADDDHQSVAAWGYSYTDVLSAGKMLYKLAYDGSLADKSLLNRIGKSIAHYYLNADQDYLSLIDNYYDMGSFLAIPVEAITESQPLSFWVEVARTEYLRNCDNSNLPRCIDVASYDGLSDSGLSEQVELCHGVALWRNALLTMNPVEMSVSQWNEARLKTISPRLRSYYGTVEKG